MILFILCWVILWAVFLWLLTKWQKEIRASDIIMSLIFGPIILIVHTSAAIIGLFQSLDFAVWKNGGEK